MNAAPPSDRRRSAAFLRSLALGCASVALATMPSPGGATDLPVIKVGEPEGFSDLTAEQTLLVDVYSGGIRLGDAAVIATPGAVRIANPSALLDLIPGLSDRPAVESALSAANLPANSDRVCSANTDRARCGRLSPEVIGVILDRERLRLDVFLNPRFLAVHEIVRQRYLPMPAEGLSMINAIGAVLSGRPGAGRDYYNLQDQVVLADGPRRLRADLSYATHFGLEAERLAVEWDRPELRYSAGALWTPGSDLTGRRKLLGVGAETQIDTRLDKDEIVGSPIIVYLDRRARIDLVRNGRVLNSAIYEAGNQQIDTSNLPEGSYEVVLRIDEPGQETREERRFFTRSRRIPSLGRTDFYAFGGVLIDGRDAGSLNPSGAVYVEGGLLRRLNESWAVEGAIQATDNGALIEFGGTLLTRLAQVRATAVADLDGRYGGIVQITSSGASRFNFNIDLRHFENETVSAAQGGAPGSVVTYEVGPTSLGSFANSYSQAGGVVSYSFANVHIVSVFSYRCQKAQAADYSLGPSLQWDVFRKGPFKVTLRSDVSVTEHGTTVFAGISLRLLGARTSATALGGVRSSSMRDDELGTESVGSLAGTWSVHAIGGQLALGAGMDHQPRQDSVMLSSEFHHPLGYVSGDFVRSDNGFSSHASQYSLGLQTTVTAGAGAVRLAGRTTTESIILAQVEGARDNDRFEVLVNERVVGMIVGNQPLPLALPSYRAYELRIRPTGKDLLSYDSSPRKVGLYPGAVNRLKWKVAPVSIKFGRLVAADGSPLIHASIFGKGVWSETDDAGFFQVEASDDAQLTVMLPDGRAFLTALPQGEAKNGIAQLGSVFCCGDDVIRLSGVHPLHIPAEELSE